MPDDLNPNRDVDLLINSALSTYADPRPESGIEGRILARISGSRAVAQAPPRRSRLIWVFAVPIAACLLLALVLSGVKTTHSPAGSIASVPLQPSPVTAGSFESRALPAVRPTSAHRGAAVRAALRSAPRSSPLPKLNVFPAPQPLSPEEQILARFVTEAPPAERAAFLDAQRQADSSLDIATIHIPPLDPPVKGSN